MWRGGRALYIRLDRLFTGLCVMRGGQLAMMLAALLSRPEISFCFVSLGARNEIAICRCCKLLRRSVMATWFSPKDARRCGQIVQSRCSMDLAGRALLEPNPISAEMVDVEDGLDATTKRRFRDEGAQFWWE